jgi:hypothetical protein
MNGTFWRTVAAGLLIVAAAGSWSAWGAFKVIETKVAGIERTIEARFARLDERIRYLERERAQLEPR